MVLDMYILLVAVAAVIYACIARFLQNKMVDRSKMDALQKDSKALNAEYKKASERKDKRKMEELMAKQMEMLKEMNKLMFQQFKPMMIIVIIFMAIMFVVNMFNPAVQDDISISLYDDGNSCDPHAGDGIYSACIDLQENPNYGKWTATVKALRSGKEMAKNETYFLYNVKSHPDRYVEEGTGEYMEVQFDKEVYYPAESASIHAKPANMTRGFEVFGISLVKPQETNIDEVTATLSNGTYFYVELPFTIPLFEVKRIFQPQWWFIFISLITGLLVSVIISKWRKKK